MATVLGLPVAIVAALGTIFGIWLAHTDSTRGATPTSSPSSMNRTQTRTESTATTLAAEPLPNATSTRASSPCFSSALAAQLQPERPHFLTRVDESRYIAAHGPLAVKAYVRHHRTIYWLRSGRAKDGDLLDFAIMVRNVSGETAHNAELRTHFIELGYAPPTVAFRNPDHPIPLHEPEVGDLRGTIGIGDLAPNETAVLCFSARYHEAAPWPPNGTAPRPYNGKVTVEALAEQSGRAGSSSVTVAPL